MDADLVALRRLLDTQAVGALATLHRGEPAVSMVPFVLADVDAAPALVIHVSALAPHTADLRAHARAALLVTAEPDPSVPAQARPRVSLQVDADLLDGPGPEVRRARDAAGRAYLARFPDAAPTFALADFTLVALRPVAARAVAGFGRAHGLAGDRLHDWLRAPS